MPSDEMSFVAERILNYYMRDRKLFEKHSDDFDEEFIEVFEERLYNLKHLEATNKIYLELFNKKDKLRIAINQFIPLLLIAEGYVKLANYVLNVPVSYFNFSGLIETINKKRGWEIQEGVMDIIKKIEQHLPELRFKGFPEMIIDDLHLLVKIVGKLELEISELSHKRDLVSAESERAVSELWELLDYILNTCPIVFGNKNQKKKNDYFLERLMKLAHIRKQFIH